MIEISSHTPEVIYAEFPAILKILFFVGILIYSAINKQKGKQKSKTTKNNSFLDEIKEAYNQENIKTKENQNIFDPFKEFKNTTTNKSFHEGFNTDDKVASPKQKEHNKNSSITKKSVEPIKTTPKKKTTIHKKRTRINFDLKQAVIADTVLNRKY
ncbi:hypothetical protein K4L44_12320 [Halosquirtibacter laminarini]|uniref:Uncharacterized protein n=1 Tax=Halosquirtibacter laminarini TaxID=3374600 RepID=A0AC61NLZ9_9BACT|nr:hypothetical protein K4L44_12320 [Prolixibacteraceae bacterium]